MLIKRYFHIRPIIRQRRDWIANRYGGACVLVQGDTDKVGAVSVQVVFCSKKDMYNKKIGRTLVVDQPIKQVALRMLGKELLSYSEVVDKTCKIPTEDTDYNWAMRYFLPKV